MFHNVGTIEGTLIPSFEIKLDEDTPEEYLINIQSDEEENLFPEPATTTSSSIEGNSLDISSSTESLIPPNQKRPIQFTKILNCQEVRVCHIRNPSQFWVQREADKQKALNFRSSLMKYIMSHRKSLTSPTLSSLEIGSLYMAKCSIDEMWYRASVKSLISKPNPDNVEEDRVGMVEVYYIDYGNTEILSVANMFPLDNQFKTTPPLALECCLYHIIPENGNSWNDEATTTFAQFVSNKKLLIKIIDVIDGLYYVDLSQLPNSNIIDDAPVSVRDALVFLGLAKFTTGDTKCQKPHPYLNHAKKRRQYYNPESMAPNQIYSAIISHMNNPHNFFIQQLGNSARYLAQLFHTLQEKYKDNDQNESLFVFSPYVGMPCVGKFTLDNQWYRALVTKVKGQGLVTVKYVDFGNSEELPYTRLRKITDDLMKLPAQAIACSLVDVAPPSKDEDSNPPKWDDEVKDFILDWVKGKKLFVKVHNVDHDLNKNEVSLFERINGHDLSLGALLVKENLAISIGPLSSEAYIHKPIADQAQAYPMTSSFNHASDVKVNKHPNKQKPSTSKHSEKILPSRMYIPVYVSHCEDPGNLFVQYASEEEQKKLKYLQDSIQEHIEASPLKTPEVKITSSEFYIVQHPKDKKWYRGQLIKELDNDSYQLQLIDFGQVVEVTKTALREMPSMFSSLEAMATKCHLADVSPAGGSHEWSRIATEHTSFFLNQYTSFFLDIMGAKIKGSLPVNLLVLEEKTPGPLEPAITSYISLREVLLEKGLALPCKRKEILDVANNVKNIFRWKPPVIPSKLNFRGLVMHVDYEGFFYIQLEESQGQVEEILKVLNFKSAKYGQNVVPNGLEENGEGINEEAQPFSEHSTGSSETSVQSHFPVESMKQEKCNSKPSLEIGQAIIAKFSVDNKWYRAEVSVIHEDGIEVLFVDYGNNHLIEDMNNICTDICLQDIPRLCYKCELWNLTPNTEDHLWPEDTLNALHKMTVETLFDIIVMETPVEGSPLKIVINLPNNTSFNDFLIRSLKIASYLDPSLVSEEEEEDYYPLDITEEVDDPPFPVVVTQILNANLLFIQRLPLDDPSLPNFEAVNENIEQFLQMLKSLNEEANDFPPLSDLKIGKPCCCIFPDDGNWYRAHILSIEEEAVHVLYVDYGNTASVPLDRVKMLPSQYYDLPMQAVQCKLHKIRTSLEPSHAIHELKSHLISSETSLYARVRVPGDIPEIDIIKKDGTLAYQSLIDDNILLREH